MRKKHTYLFVVSILLFVSLFSNDVWSLRKIFSPSSEIDQSSIQRKIIQSKIDSASTLYETDPFFAYSLIEEALIADINYNYGLETANAYLVLGILNHSIHRHDFSISNVNRALKFYRISGNWEKIYEC